MPPRRSARVAAATELATTALQPLPLPIVLRIFSLLPVDSRLRCAEVCRGWRSVLRERSLWTRLDLSDASGVRVPAREGAWDALLRSAAARAGGGLQSLQLGTDVEHATLLESVAANAAALQELSLEAFIDNTFVEETEALCVAAPQLRVFNTSLKFTDEYKPGIQTVRRALRNEPPFGPVCVDVLTVFGLDGLDDEAGVVAFAADVAAHESLEVLTLFNAPLGTPAALDAVVDAVLARRLYFFHLGESDLTPASAPALARLLGGNALTTLRISFNMELIDAHAAALLAAALRANSTLTSLALMNVDIFNVAAAGVELLGSLTAHPSLRNLNLTQNRMVEADRTAVGAALGALVAANAPALTELEVCMCNLHDEGLRPLFEALPHNTHLRVLNCSYNIMSDVVARDLLMPAVRANTSLRKLQAGEGHRRTIPDPSIVEAENLVNNRAQA